VFGIIADSDCLKQARCSAAVWWLTKWVTDQWAVIRSELEGLRADSSERTVLGEMGIVEFEREPQRSEQY
jgi:hypothetical protein